MNVRLQFLYQLSNKYIDIKIVGSYHNSPSKEDKSCKRDTEYIDNTFIITYKLLHTFVEINKIHTGVVSLGLPRRGSLLVSMYGHAT